ncbi:hypothetical protein DVH24_034068 [Malus domestica]|uniref:Uncharacterized protein n=1 Tax=Malus domestica TaxID=3750 RepID=A0A498KQR3_MALDO|nr:hypothetical protein DVH24_034068 [Malus domestica]
MRWLWAEDEDLLRKRDIGQPLMDLLINTFTDGDVGVVSSNQWPITTATSTPSPISSKQTLNPKYAPISSKRTQNLKSTLISSKQIVNPKSTPISSRQTLNPNPNPSLGHSPSPTTPSPLDSNPSSKTNPKKSHGHEVVENKIKVYWPLDKNWYQGYVNCFNKYSVRQCRRRNVEFGNVDAQFQTCFSQLLWYGNRQRMDAKRRRPVDANYDQITLYLPPGFLKSFRWPEIMVGV